MFLEFNVTCVNTKNNFKNRILTLSKHYFYVYKINVTLN